MRWIAFQWRGEKCWGVNTAEKQKNKRRVVVYSTTKANAKKITKEHNRREAS